MRLLRLRKLPKLRRGYSPSGNQKLKVADIFRFFASTVCEFAMLIFLVLLAGTFDVPLSWTCLGCGHEAKYSKDYPNYLCNSDPEELYENASCRLPYDFTRKPFGTPSLIWRQQREAYKSAIIYDLPAKIPARVAPHLQSEIERMMYKLAKRTAQIAVDANYQHPDSYKPKTPKEVMKDLDTFKIEGPTRGIRQQRALRSLHDIFDTSYQHTRQDIIKEDFFNAIECLKSIDHIDAELEGREGRIARGEFVKHKDLIVEVKGSKGETYKVNYDRGWCTCKAYEFRCSCKHVEQREFTSEARSEKYQRVEEEQERDRKYRRERLERAYQASLEYTREMNASGSVGGCASESTGESATQSGNIKKRKKNK